MADRWLAECCLMDARQRETIRKYEDIAELRILKMLSKRLFMADPWCRAVLAAWGISAILLLSGICGYYALPIGAGVKKNEMKVIRKMPRKPVLRI